MSYQGHWQSTEQFGSVDQLDPCKDHVSSRNETAQLRATSLYLIQSIVKRHGGTTEVDLATNTINIDVPDSQATLCAKEIEDQMGRMCH